MVALLHSVFSLILIKYGGYKSFFNSKEAFPMSMLTYTIIFYYNKVSLFSWSLVSHELKRAPKI